MRYSILGYYELPSAIFCTFCTYRTVKTFVIRSWNYDHIPVCVCEPN